MYDRSAVSLRLLHMLPRFLEERGVSVDASLARAGIDPGVVDWSRHVVSRAQICAVLNDAARRAGEPVAGLGLGPYADPMKLGMSGRALFGGMTLEDCLRGHARHMPTLQAGVALGIQVHGDTAFWCHQLRDSDPDDARVLNEGIAAFVIAAIRRVTGRSGIPFRLTLPHRPQASICAYESGLQADIRFSTGYASVIAFDASLLRLPNVLLGGSSADGVRPSRGGALPLMPAVVALSDRALIESVQRIIDAIMLTGPPSLLRVARTLGYPPRSLQRQLAQCGTSFEVLVDERRRQNARRYLADDSVSVGSVALALGYTDPAHFVRAFRRWEGLTPLQFRRGILAAV